MAQLTMVLLALFARMERTHTFERAAHARSVAEAKGRRAGRPVTVSADRIRYAVPQSACHGVGLDWPPFLTLTAVNGEPSVHERRPAALEFD